MNVLIGWGVQDTGIVEAFPSGLIYAGVSRYYSPLSVSSSPS
jgi:hypothetical protein